jgi:hypothetical protein
MEKIKPKNLNHFYIPEFHVLLEKQLKMGSSVLNQKLTGCAGIHVCNKLPLLIPYVDIYLN